MLIENQTTVQNGGLIWSGRFKRDYIVRLSLFTVSLNHDTFSMQNVMSSIIVQISLLSPLIPHLEH